jgi:hypothetical protein
MFSPNGKRLVSSSWDHTVKIQDTETGECWATLWATRRCCVWRALQLGMEYLLGIEIHQDALIDMRHNVELYWRMLKLIKRLRRMLRSNKKDGRLNPKRKGGNCGNNKSWIGDATAFGAVGLRASKLFPCRPIAQRVEKGINPSVTI